MGRLDVLCVVLLCGALAAGIGAKPLVRELDEFHSIRTCLPFHLLIKPTDGEYSFTIDAEEGMEEAISSEVKDSVLVLTTATGFNSTQAIRVWVSMPKDGLRKIVKAAAADVVLEHGFKVEQLELVTSGLGRMVIYDLTADDLVLQSKEISTIVVDGKIKRARVSGASTSTVFLRGVVNSVEAYISGLSKLFIVSASGRLSITGRARGLAQVSANKGRCKLRGDFFRRACLIEPVEFPDEAPLFSCGVLSDGGLKCNPDSVDTTSFLSSGATSSSAFASTGTSIGSSSTASFGRSSARDRARARTRTRLSIGRGQVDTLITSRASASAFSFGGSASSFASGSSFGSTSTSTISGTTDSSGSTITEDASASAQVSGDGEAIAVVSQTCLSDSADRNMF